MVVAGAPKPITEGSGMKPDAVILIHATMRTPNLKARLASAREEFRAVWRGYNDYTI